jgi:hypothetical protein
MWLVHKKIKVAAVGSFFVAKGRHTQWIVTASRRAVLVNDAAVIPHEGARPFFIIQESERDHGKIRFFQYLRLCINGQKFYRSQAESVFEPNYVIRSQNNIDTAAAFGKTLDAFVTFKLKFAARPKSDRFDISHFVLHFHFRFLPLLRFMGLFLNSVRPEMRDFLQRQGRRGF